MTQKEYSVLIKKRSDNSRGIIDCIKAFVFGGIICAVGQGLADLFMYLGADKDTSKTLCSVSLIALGVLLTALHQYERLAKHAGAGTLVPITGFANAMSSPAIEFRAEGMITGLAAKMFAIAGPVLVYGVSSAIVYGVIYWLIGLL